MTNDTQIRSLLLASHGNLMKALQLNCQYEIDDLIQECHLYMAKRDHLDLGFMKQHVNNALVDLMRKEFGQSRRYDTLEEFQQHNKQYLKTHARHYLFSDPIDRTAETLTATLPVASDVPGIVAMAMGQLSVRQWWIVVERYWFGLGLKEIGQRLGVTDGRVSQLLTEALGRLRQILPPEGDLI